MDFVSDVRRLMRSITDCQAACIPQDARRGRRLDILELARLATGTDTQESLLYRGGLRSGSSTLGVEMISLRSI